MSIFDLATKFWPKNHVGTVIVVFLLVVGSFATFAHGTVLFYGLPLPQVALGVALYVIASAFGAVGLIAVWPRAKPEIKRPLSPHEELFANNFEDPSRRKYYVQVSGEGLDGMGFSKLAEGGGELRAYLDFANFTAKPVRIEHITGAIVVENMVVAKLQQLRPLNIAAYARESIYLETELSAEVVRRIETYIGNLKGAVRSTGLQLTVSIDTGGKKEDLQRNLTTGSFRFVGFPPVYKN